MGSIEKPRISKATLDKKAESNFFTELKSRFQALEKENKELKKENKELKQRYEFLKNEVNEPKELDDKWANSKIHMFVRIVIVLMDGSQTWERITSTRNYYNANIVKKYCALRISWNTTKKTKDGSD